MADVSIITFPHICGIPQYQTQGASGVDLLAACSESITIAPGARATIPTGVGLVMNGNLEAQVRPRSGLALKHGITVLNTPGTIDADYRGEIGVSLINLGNSDFVVERGARIAQLVFAPIARFTHTFDTVTARRVTGGFGSTGQ